MQATLEGLLITQGRLEVPPTNAQINQMTKEEVAAETFNVVTGHIQIPVLYLNTYVLFDKGAMHSFVSSSFVRKLGKIQEPMRHEFTTTLPSGEVMLSTHYLRMISLRVMERELFADLIILDM